MELRINGVRIKHSRPVVFNQDVECGSESVVLIYYPIEFMISGGKYGKNFTILVTHIKSCQNWKISS